jgi:hypothetical protein
MSPDIGPVTFERRQTLERAQPALQPHAPENGARLRMKVRRLYRRRLHRQRHSIYLLEFPARFEDPAISIQQKMTPMGDRVHGLACGELSRATDAFVLLTHLADQSDPSRQPGVQKGVECARSEALGDEKRRSLGTASAPLLPHVSASDTQ